MKGKNLISCIKISVDCVANDPVDIRCGGPEYLGFDFFVKEEENEHIKKFIKETLNEFNIPLYNIYFNGKEIIDIKNIWTKERILKEIKKESSYLKQEAQRNYCRSLYRR